MNNTVTVNEMLEVLNTTGNKGAKFVSIVALTFPTMIKKHRLTGEPNPFKRGVSRLVHRNVALGVNYEAAVNRTRQSEIDQMILALEADSLMDPTEKATRLAGLRNPPEMFRAESLWHGMGISVEGQPYCVTHKLKGGLYFAAKPSQHWNDSTIGTTAPVVQELWRNVATDEVVDPDTLTHYLPPAHKATKQGVAHDVFWRTYGLDGGKDGTAGYILQLRYAGMHYMVKHS